MILITGAVAQGKRAFVEKQFTEGPVVWADGVSDTWETCLNAEFCCNFHMLVRKKLMEIDPEGKLEPEESAGWLAEALLQSGKTRILVTDEIGCGIVPLDPFERRYRECTGRVCCRLAKEAEQVWRVVCGLGQRIK